MPVNYFGNEIDDDLRDILDDILNNRTEYDERIEYVRIQRERDSNVIEERPTLTLDLPYEDDLELDIDDYTEPTVIDLNEDTNTPTSEPKRVVVIDL